MGENMDDFSNYINQLLKKLITIPDFENESFYTTNQNHCILLLYRIKDDKLRISIMAIVKYNEITINNIYLRLQGHNEIAYKENLFNFLNRLRKPNQERFLNKIEEYILIHG